MTSTANGGYVIVSSGQSSGSYGMPLSMLGNDLTHEETKERMRGLMKENSDLRDALNYNNSKMQGFCEAIKAMQEKQQEENRIHKMQYEQAKQVVMELRHQLESKDKSILQLSSQVSENSEPSGEASSHLAEELTQVKQQVQSLYREKMSLIRQNQHYQEQIQKSIVSEEQHIRKSDTAPSSGSTIPVTVGNQQVTEDDIFEDTEVTIFDDVALPAATQKLSGQSQVEKELEQMVVRLQAQVEEYQVKLQAKENQNENNNEDSATLRLQITQVIAALQERDRRIQHAETVMKEREEQRAQIENDNQKLRGENSMLQQLATDHHKLLEEKAKQKHNPDVSKEELDRLYGQTIAQEDLITKLRDENKKFKAMADQIEVHRLEANTYKEDFEAERKARVDMHDEKLRIEEELKAMQMRYQDLQDEMQSMSQAQVSQMQQHGARQLDNPAAHFLNQYRPQPTTYANVPRSRQGNMTEAITYECPLCSRKFPDVDSLQVHCTDCTG